MKGPNKEFCKIVEEALEDSKAQDIMKIDLFNKSSLCDYMFVATSTSSRHMKAICDNIIKEFKKIEISNLSRENGESWSVLDIGDIIVHIFQKETRDVYNLEKIWNKIEQSDQEDQQEE